MIDQDTIKIVGIAGSLRKHSYNRALLRAAPQEAPDGVAIDIIDISAIPPYNGDVEARGAPPPVQELKQHIASADALLFATPEYNFGIPGVLKNAIDWASRPPRETPLRGKPVGIIGASPGNFGTALAQAALRQCLLFPGCNVMPTPQLLVFRASDRFDEEGNLTDDATRSLLRDYLAALLRWTKQMQPQGEEVLVGGSTA